MKGYSDIGISYGHFIWLLPIEIIKISISHISVEDIRIGTHLPPILHYALYMTSL